MRAAQLWCGALLALLFTAPHCSARELVGGPCSYLAHRGVAEVIAAGDKRSRLRFLLDPAERDAADALLQRVDGDEFELENESLPAAVTGLRIPAQALVITRGTCTPVIYEMQGRDGRR